MFCRDLANQRAPTMSAASSSGADAGAYDHLFKVLIIGDSGVGKSCLMFRFTDDTFGAISRNAGVSFWLHFALNWAMSSMLPLNWAMSRMLPVFFRFAGDFRKSKG